jgi:sterol desaturase/sphingolipid hydroxylase (fatty acid hydroxylase superfamily)
MTFIAYFFIFNISLIIIDTITDLIRSKQRRWKDTGANIVIFIFNKLIEKTLIGSIGLICLMPIHWITPLAIPMNALTWVLAFLTADLSYYWMHRIEHEKRVLWALHSVHHSSQDYNLSVSFRLSILEGLVEWIFLVPMILIGFNPFQAIVGLILVAQFQTWIHTERIGKLGKLDNIFNTPSVHSVHHGSNKKYLDKNYGGFLIIWDRIFGTYQKEEEKVIYGLTKNINTNNPVSINFIEFNNMYRDLKKCSSYSDQFKIIVGHLSWRPDYFNEESNKTKV